jgi:hypothetical protein
MNLKLHQFNFDQVLDGCFIALIAVVFGYILVSLVTFPWVPE